MRLTLTATATATAIALLAVAGAAHAQEPGPLSPARFAALDSTYTSSIALDESPAADADAVANARRVCDALDRSDRLLEITRRSCLTGLKISAALETSAACETRSGCRRNTRQLRIAFTQLIVDARASNQIVALELPPGPCRTQLTAGRGLLRSLEKLRDGLRLAERALLTRNGTVLRHAQRLTHAAIRELSHEPTPQQSRRTFRRVCAPAQTPAVPPAPVPAPTL